MKKFIFTLLLSLSAGFMTFAQQTFQGTLSYSFHFEGEGIEAMSAMLPTSINFQVYKTNMRMNFDGGMMSMLMGDMLIQGKTGKTYMIKDSEQTAYEIAPEEEDATPAPVIEKEDEVIDILGYPCQKYKMTTQTGGEESVSYVWVTDKLTFPKMQGSSAAGGFGGSLSVEGLNGMPLKTETTEGDVTVVMVASRLTIESLDKNLFKVPKGYEVKPFDANSFGGF